MKQSTLCLLSGIAGALFAMACGTMDGLSKDANADDHNAVGSVAISVVTGDCVVEETEINGILYQSAGLSGWSDFMAEARANDYVVTGQAVVYNVNSLGCEFPTNENGTVDVEGEEAGAVYGSWRVAYIK